MNAYFVGYSINTGKFNMDFDEKLLTYAVENNLSVPVLRFYGWKPSCVSLGRNQKEDKINKKFCQSDNIDIVRRLTGGRALLHANELTYSFICPSAFLKNGESVIQSYKEISGALVSGLKKLGLDTDFPTEKKTKTKFEYCMSLSTGADLTFKGKKIVGSAQFRKQGYILQHGSILFDCSSQTIERIFAEKPDEEHIAMLKDIIPSLTVEELCNALKNGFEEYFSVKFNNILAVL